MNFFRKVKYGLLFLLLFISMNNLFAMNESTRDSLFSSDGPCIIYNDGNIYSYGVYKSGEGFRAYKKEIAHGETLECKVDETGQRFSFKLKDSITKEKSVFEIPEKMLLISDIEGNFKGFQAMLMGAGVINKEFEWTFGNGHLVFAGDMFDRNLNVTECLWLIYKLEDEAVKQNGKVHFIMGNHEVMNLKKDFRYVRQKYFINADSMKLEYEKWYDRNSELGRWLRSKNCIEKIGDLLVVHGGVSNEMPLGEMTLEEINEKFRERLDAELTKEEIRKDIFLGRESAIWYRGIAEEKMAGEDLERILAKTGTTKMIIGHTIFEEIKQLYGGKVIAIDLEHRQNTENGFMKCLITEGKNFYVINDKGEKTPL